MLQIFIPRQESGAQSDTIKTVHCKTAEEARILFRDCIPRLKKVNDWHHIAGKGTATFQLTDPSGQAVGRELEVGDHVRISLPLPADKPAGASDWVRIEDIRQHINPTGIFEFVFFRVRPCDDPLRASDNTAHFFDGQATSTFLVQRKNNAVTAGVHGRNEHANTAGIGLLEKVRNRVIAIAAKLGLSTTQWQKLLTGILGRSC